MSCKLTLSRPRSLSVAAEEVRVRTSADADADADVDEDEDVGCVEPKPSSMGGKSSVPSQVRSSNRLSEIVLLLPTILSPPLLLYRMWNRLTVLRLPSMSVWGGHRPCIDPHIWDGGLVGWKHSGYTVDRAIVAIRHFKRAAKQREISEVERSGAAATTIVVDAVIIYFDPNVITGRSTIWHPNVQHLAVFVHIPFAGGVQRLQFARQEVKVINAV